MSVLKVQVPLGQRQGQAIFNFLEWLTTQDYAPNQTTRMADPFFIEDDELDELWEQWLKS